MALAIARVSTNSLREALPLLRRASELLESKERWVQGMWAADEHGEACLPTEEKARAWCVAGAIARVASEQGFEVQAESTPAGVPLAVEGPKRVKTALTLLVQPMLVVYCLLYPEEFAAKEEESQERAAAGQRPAGEEELARLETTLIPVLVQEDRRFEYRHLTVVLETTIQLTEEELRRRRQAKRDTTPTGETTRPKGGRS
jgi:hypothetical protein